jgi:hypothetical protein
LWEARVDFSGGTPGQMVYARLWFRAPDEALPHARPTVRFDALEGQTVGPSLELGLAFHGIGGLQLLDARQSGAVLFPGSWASGPRGRV